MPRKYSTTWARQKLSADREELVKYACHKAAGGGDAIKTLRTEANKAGATLARDGEGGLDPNLALETFRRGKYQCAVPGCKTAREKLDLDHIGGHAHELEQDPKAASWLKAEAAKGKQNTPEGLHVLCLRHHDMVHQRERAIDSGKKPPAMSR